MSSVAGDEKTRLDILRVLYERARGLSHEYMWHVSHGDLIQTLHVPNDSLAFNIAYLKQKHLVNVRETTDTWTSAAITADGMDIVERVISLEEESKKEKPDKGKVRVTLDWLKANAGWIVPTLWDIIKNIKI